MRAGEKHALLEWIRNLGGKMSRFHGDLLEAGTRSAIRSFLRQIGDKVTHPLVSIPTTCE